MNKTLLIIRHEFLTRVKKKSFIISSILGPLVFALMLSAPTLIAMMNTESKVRMAVIDETGGCIDYLKSEGQTTFEPCQLPLDSIKARYKDLGYDAFIVIGSDPESPDGVKVYSDAAISIDTKSLLSGYIENYVRDKHLNTYGNREDAQAIIDDINGISVSVTTISIKDDGQEFENSSEMNMVVSLVFALLIYMFVIIYATQVMRGVNEEKSSRIVEVIVSSVKPFQLMMGKVVGIALVAFAQVILWGILTTVIVSGIGTMISGGASAEAVGDMTQMTQQTAQLLDEAQNAATSESSEIYNTIMSKLNGLNALALCGYFIFFFVGGYLLYASLFAALGAAMDNETDGQQFTTILMVPLIVSIYIAMLAVRDPNSSAAFWFSIIPFTSPIVMMARIPFQIPAWEIALSMVLLAATFVLCIWVSARIYRTGLLMYGKKLTFKELIKWFKQAD